LAIDLSPQKLQDLCTILNKFALPRAIADFERRLFVAWNPKFLERTGFSEDEMKASKPEELLAVEESWSPLSEENRRPVEYTSCAVRRPFGADPAPGFVVRSHGKMGYVMLDVFESSSAQFEQGRNVGREEERNRIVRTFHDEVSSSLISALFLIETAKSELEDAQLPQTEAVSKASDALAEATEKIETVLGEQDTHPE
jgi:signal transduction histidine kinase